MDIQIPQIYKCSIAYSSSLFKFKSQYSKKYNENMKFLFFLYYSLLNTIRIFIMNI